MAALTILPRITSRAYDAYNENHVFATMSVRLCIDVNLANPLSLPLMQTAVNVYMRIVDSVQSHLTTFGVSETKGYRCLELDWILWILRLISCLPKRTYAAMQHLCRGKSWALSIRTFAAKLLGDRLGQEGRIVFAPNLHSGAYPDDDQITVNTYRPVETRIL
jgi:hypothetical protein